MVGRNCNRRRLAGFSLIEVLVVLSILGVLIAVAAPNLRDFIASQVVKTPASDLYSSLVLARSEAIKRNGPVELVPTGADWAQGWRVRVQAGGVVLRTQDPYQRVSISSSTAGNVTYGGNGRLATSATTFRVLVPGNTHARMRCVGVDVSGRPSVRVDNDTDQTVCN